MLFLVWTNHKNLEYIHTAKLLNSHQACWSLFSRFNFTLSFHSRSKNKPDAPSCISPHLIGLISPEISFQTTVLLVQYNGTLNPWCALPNKTTQPPASVLLTTCLFPCLYTLRSCSGVTLPGFLVILEQGTYRHS